MAFDLKNATQAERKREYDRIAEEMGDDQFFTKKELNYLPEILQDGEELLAFTSGFLDGSTWLLSLTDRRIIFLDKGMFFGLRQMIIPLNRVNAVSGETGIFFGTILITDGATTRRIENVWKKTVKAFTNKVQEAINRLNLQQKMPAVLQEDKYTKLEKISELKDKGVLTEEEFNIEKQKILNGN